MPGCPALVVDSKSLCPKLGEITPFEGKKFREDFECSRHVAMGHILKKPHLEYRLVKRKMREKGWVVHTPPRGNVLALPRRPMWLPVYHRLLHRRMNRDGDSMTDSDSD